MVPGHPYISDFSSLFCLDKGFQGAIRSADGIQVLFTSYVMDLPKIQIIGMQPLQGFFQVGLGAYSITFSCFAGLENFLPGRRIFLPDGAKVEFTVLVGRRRIKIGYPLRQGFLYYPVRMGSAAGCPQYALAAQADCSDLLVSGYKKDFWMASAMVILMSLPNQTAGKVTSG